MKDKVLIIIPARAASTRFPNKPLAMIKGHTLLERVWRIACSISVKARTVIATESIEVQKLAHSFGAEAVLSSKSCPTGSDRAFQVAEQLENTAEIIAVLQGDAVLTPPWILEETISSISSNPDIQIATPAVKLEGQAMHDFIQLKKMGSSTGTSVVFDSKKNALYFSKGLIPHARNSEATEYYRHIGLYVYRRSALQKFSSLSQGSLELAEGLEQLRALENGIPIKVVEVNYRGRTHASIDNPEDVNIVERIIEKEGELAKW